MSNIPEASDMPSFLNIAKASLGGSKSLVDLSGEGQAVLLLHDAPEPDRPDRIHAAASQGAGHLLPRRGAARGGWRFINQRRAINLDPNCGWARGKADVLYVADAFAVVAKLNELLGPKCITHSPRAGMLVTVAIPRLHIGRYSLQCTKVNKV